MGDSGDFLFLIVPIPAIVALVAGFWALSQDGKAIEVGGRNKRAIGIAAWMMFGAAVAYFAMYWFAVESQFDYYAANLDIRCPANRSHLWWLALPWFAPVIAGMSFLTIVFVLRVEEVGRSLRQLKTTLWVVGLMAILPFVYTFNHLTLLDFGDGPPPVNFCPEGPNAFGE